MPKFNLNEFKTYIMEKVQKVSSETFGWLAVVILHSATVPGLLAVSNGLTDKLPPIDIVLLIWTGLVLMFAKAAVQKDMLNIVTIGLGFMIQSVLMAFIFIG